MWCVSKAVQLSWNRYEFLELTIFVAVTLFMMMESYLNGCV